MSDALKAFRAQREEMEQIRARLTQVVELPHAIRSEANAVARDEGPRKLMQEEQTWLARLQDLIRQVRGSRELEVSLFWSAMWCRRTIAVVLARLAAAALGTGHVSETQSYEAEMASLKFRVEVRTQSRVGY
jgi:hypothetical protein